VEQTSQDRANIIKAIRQCLALTNTYGKTADDMAIMVDGFITDLAEFPGDKVMLAFRTHARHCDRMPTLKDIRGLIERNGRAEVKESDIIALRQKADWEKTPDDWALIRDYENRLYVGWGGKSDTEKIAELRHENKKLRERIKALEANNSSKKIGQSTVCKSFSASIPDSKSQLEQTIDWMRQTGASYKAIQETIKFEEGKNA